MLSIGRGSNVFPHLSVSKRRRHYISRPGEDGDIPLPDSTRATPRKPILGTRGVERPSLEPRRLKAGQFDLIGGAIVTGNLCARSSASDASRSLRHSTLNRVQRGRM